MVRFLHRQELEPDSEKWLDIIIPVADRCHAVGMAGCGHSKIARVRAYYLYCMCLALLTSV